MCIIFTAQEVIKTRYPRLDSPVWKLWPDQMIQNRWNVKAGMWNTGVFVSRRRLQPESLRHGATLHPIRDIPSKMHPKNGSHSHLKKLKEHFSPRWRVYNGVTLTQQEVNIIISVKNTDQRNPFLMNHRLCVSRPVVCRACGGRGCHRECWLMGSKRLTDSELRQSCNMYTPLFTIPSGCEPQFFAAALPSSTTHSRRK